MRSTPIPLDQIDEFKKFAGDLQKHESSLKNIISRKSRLMLDTGNDVDII